VETVKTHLRALFDRFDVEDLPHNQKRARLVELALQSGTVTPHELSR
jgi:DNA-binding NarL/FixJ family response regulator